MESNLVVRSMLCFALVSGAVHAQPATAAGCGAPEAKSPSTEARPSGPPLNVSDAHTVEQPLTVRYEHRVGANVFHQVGVMDDLVHTLVQARSQHARSHLWVRAEFSKTATDIDLYAYDAEGEMRGWSDSANNPVEDQVYELVFDGSDTGGPGFENIDALEAPRCATFTVETQNTQALRQTPVTLKIWLAPPER